MGGEKTQGPSTTRKQRAPVGMTVGFRYAKRTCLLRVHNAKLLPQSALHRHDQQSPQPRLPAQNQRVPRIHLRLRRRPPGLLGKPRRCPQSHSPRKATQKLEKRKEALADSPRKPQIPRPIRRLVRKGSDQSARSLNHSFQPHNSVIPSEARIFARSRGTLCYGRRRNKCS